MNEERKKERNEEATLTDFALILIDLYFLLPRIVLTYDLLADHITLSSHIGQ